MQSVHLYPMYITWLGHSCFKIEDKVAGNDVSIIMDPYNKDIGFKLPRSRADIVTVSHNHPGHNNSEEILGNGEKPPMIIDRSGEYEVKGVFVTGVGSYHDKEEGAKYGKSTMFKVEINGVIIAHLGDLGTKLSEQQLSKLDDIDILLIPVGGGETIGTAEAVEIVRELEPRIVIPMHYKTPDLKKELEKLDKFKKELGVKEETMPKLKISKKELIEEDIKLIILEK